MILCTYNMNAAFPVIENLQQKRVAEITVRAIGTIWEATWHVRRIELDEIHRIQINSCKSLNPDKLPSSSFVRMAMVRV